MTTPDAPVPGASAPEMDAEFVRLVGEAAAIRHHQGCAYNNLPESALPLWAWHRAEVERAYDKGFKDGNDYAFPGGAQGA